MTEIKLTRNQTALVDDCDAHLRGYRWHAHFDPKLGGFYARTSFYIGGPGHRQISILLHHAIVGRPLYGRLVDHINGDTLDNRRENLRFVTARQNQANQGKQRRGETRARFVGVHPFMRGGWKAQIKINGRQRHLGVFKTDIEAAQAYQKALTEINGGRS